MYPNIYAGFGFAIPWIPGEAHEMAELILWKNASELYLR